MRWACYGVLLGFAAIACAPAGFGDEVEGAAATLRVPAGFSVELVAAAPLVQHPVMAGFDERGRLYVADNAGLNLPAEELLEKLPNMIRMLEDTDGDGRFDRGTLFADKMTFPQGAAWYRGALYVASPPSIWRLEDTDGDGVADRREELVNKFGFNGNAADIHGCFLTPTGRIAWCDGRHGHTFTSADGRVASEGLAARVFSCRPDGSNVEVFCGGGMDNPVEIAFTPDGEMIGTMTFYNPDNARHDALVHFVYGGVYPRRHPCTSEFKRTGELMPALSRVGPVAPSGLACYAGAAWGEEYRGNLFSVQFNTHKVVRHVLARQGATFSSADEDFLVSANPDFHPTDVLQDADGSLLVIDTGGWFRIGCPTSQIAKPEVGGGIYRIRRTAAVPVADPRGLKIDWQKLTDAGLSDLLEDPRPAVVERAIDLLARHGDASTGPLMTTLFDSTDFRARQNGVWVLSRIGSENARMLLRQALGDDDAPVRLAAVHSISDLRDASSLTPLVDILKHDEPALVREAATALGRLGQAAAVPALLEGLRQPADRFVEHALIYALIEINDPRATRAGLAHESPNVRRGALVALDQMDAERLTRDVVAPLLATDDVALLRTIVEILAKHPDWADELTGTIAAWLALEHPSGEQLATMRGAVSALIPRVDVQKSIAGALLRDATCREIRLMLLEVIAESEWDKVPATLSDAVRHNLASTDRDVLRQAIMTSTLDPRGFANRLTEIGLDEKQPNDLRVAALCTAGRSHPPLSEAAFAFLAPQLNEQGGVRERLAAAEAIGSCELTAGQLERVARLVERCGPMEVSWLLRAFEQKSSDRAHAMLFESLAKYPALASLSVDRIDDAFKHGPPQVRAAARKLVAGAAPDAAAQGAKLESLRAAIPAGDAGKGEDVFFGQRAACGACHRIGGRGEKIGPELSRIGEVRSRRDLLEAIVLPSASLARGYESFSATTKEGKVHNGLVSRQTAAAVYLRTTDRAEVRIDRGDLDELVPSRTSIMPQGLDKVLSTVELGDLLAYLESLK